MKYTIMHVNDRAFGHMEHTKRLLSAYDYLSDIVFFDGNRDNGRAELINRGLRLNSWNPYDGRTSDPLPGEYGVWVSTLNLFEYIVKNNIDKILVLEDDITLKDNFAKTLESCLQEIPTGWDFLSLHHFQGQNYILESSDIGSKFIHKSVNQPAAAQAMVYSFSGARKLLSLMKRKGMEYTNDCFIYEQSRVGAVNGYSLNPNIGPVLQHEHAEVRSSIDPNGLRSVGL